MQTRKAPPICTKTKLAGFLLPRKPLFLIDKLPTMAGDSGINSICLASKGLRCLHQWSLPQPCFILQDLNEVGGFYLCPTSSAVYFNLVFESSAAYIPTWGFTPYGTTISFPQRQQKYLMLVAKSTENFPEANVNSGF